MSELVSIITPMYNAEEYISYAIESVLNQEYQNWEHLVIDDGSSDTSIEIVKKYANIDKRIKLIQLEENGGVASARNYGLKIARGEYIAFLDSDDMWKTDKLRKQLQFMKLHNAVFSYTGYDICNSEGVLLKSIIPKRTRLCYKDLLKSNDMACCTIVIKKEISLNMPNIGHEDYATWLNILKKYQVEAIGIRQTLSIYRKTSGSISSNKLKTVKWIWNIYHNDQRLGLMYSLYCLMRFYIRTIKKYIIG